MGVLERIVCGVDGSRESLEAVRQSALLLERDGRLVLVAVVDPAEAIHFRLAATPLRAAKRALEEIERLDAEAVETLERARGEAGEAAEVTTRVLAGRPATCLLRAAEEESATLLAVGTHGLGRAAGLVMGSAATRVLYGAACSVLVARAPTAGSWRPRAIVAGVDESAQSEPALRVCGELAERFGGEVRTLALAAGPQAHALVDDAGRADLLVVGSPGPGGGHGLRSVAEHVAHDAGCSVLVVRGLPPAGRERAAKGR